MADTQSLPIAKGGGKRAGIQTEFKKPAAKRSIRFATKQQAADAGQWAVKRYPKTFKALAA